MRDLACCSLRMMKGLPYSSKTMDMVAALWGRRSGLRLSGNSATACSEDFSTRAALPEGFDCSDSTARACNRRE
mgnify:CR=1 FL=1